MFPKIMVSPPNHQWINRVFHHKPSILGYPYFWKHPNVPTKLPSSWFRSFFTINPRHWWYFSGFRTQVGLLCWLNTVFSTGIEFSTEESRRFDLGRQPKDLRRQGTSAVEGTGDWLLSLCKAEVLWNPHMTKRALKFR